MSRIIVKKPKPEKENFRFSNVDKREMVKFLKSIFKGKITSRFPLELKTITLLLHTYAKDCWKMQTMEYFKEREFHWPHNGEKVAMSLKNG